MSWMADRAAWTSCKPFVYGDDGGVEDDSVVGVGYLGAVYNDMAARCAE